MRLQVDSFVIIEVVQGTLLEGGIRTWRERERLISWKKGGEWSRLREDRTARMRWKRPGFVKE